MSWLDQTLKVVKSALQLEPPKPAAASSSTNRTVSSREQQPRISQGAAPVRTTAAAPKVGPSVAVSARDQPMISQGYPPVRTGNPLTTGAPASTPVATPNTLMRSHTTGMSRAPIAAAVSHTPGERLPGVGTFNRPAALKAGERTQGSMVGAVGSDRPGQSPASEAVEFAERTLGAKLPDGGAGNTSARPPIAQPAPAVQTPIKGVPAATPAAEPVPAAALPVLGPPAPPAAGAPAVAPPAAEQPAAALPGVGAAPAHGPTSYIPGSAERAVARAQAVERFPNAKAALEQILTQGPTRATGATDSAIKAGLTNAFRLPEGVVRSTGPTPAGMIAPAPGDQNELGQPAPRSMYHRNPDGTEDKGRYSQEMIDWFAKQQAGAGQDSANGINERNMQYTGVAERLADGTAGTLNQEREKALDFGANQDFQEAKRESELDVERAGNQGAWRVDGYRAKTWVPDTAAKNTAQAEHNRMYNVSADKQAELGVTQSESGLDRAFKGDQAALDRFKDMEMQTNDLGSKEWVAKMGVMYQMAEGDANRLAQELIARRTDATNRANAEGVQTGENYREVTRGTNQVSTVKATATEQRATDEAQYTGPQLAGRKAVAEAGGRTNEVKDYAALEKTFGTHKDAFDLAGGDATAEESSLVALFQAAAADPSGRLDAQLKPLMGDKRYAAVYKRMQDAAQAKAKPTR